MKETSWCLFLKKSNLKHSPQHLDDLLNIANKYFDGLISQIYPSEFHIDKANSSKTEAPFVDLHLSILDGFIWCKIYFLVSVLERYVLNDCIDSWSLPSFLFLNQKNVFVKHYAPAPTTPPNYTLFFTKCKVLYKINSIFFCFQKNNHKKKIMKKKK